jgi:hypothetical protein
MACNRSRKLCGVRSAGVTWCGEAIKNPGSPTAFLGAVSRSGMRKKSQKIFCFGLLHGVNHLAQQRDHLLQQVGRDHHHTSQNSVALFVDLIQNRGIDPWEI